MTKYEYWKECVSQSFDDCGIVATDEQIATVTKDVQTSHENVGLAFFEPSGDGGQGEIQRLKKELDDEKHKRWCEHCKGKGSITLYGPSHQSTSQCYVCNGTGKI